MYPPTLNIICFAKKIHFFEALSVYFKSETVKSNCPVLIFRKMMKYLKIYCRLSVYLTSFTGFFLEI